MVNFDNTTVMASASIAILVALTAIVLSTGSKDKPVRTRIFKFIYLNDVALVNLINYKYKSGEYTAVDQAMQPFWNWSVQLLPMWMAPNLVTFIGLCLCIIGHVTVISFSQDYNMNPVPSWAFYMFAVVLFLYQTLDAIDGKQARRTGEGSPLGQLFDHGCDAFNLGLGLVVSCTAMNLRADTSFLLFAWQYIIGFIPFAFAQLEEYHSGVLKTANGALGITEVQFIGMTVFVISGFFGTFL